jgi:hypothetical protein
MKKTALKSNSTQKFIGILDVFEEVVILSEGNACIIIEVDAINFDLLSEQEQDAKIYAYSSLLNSLSFSIQIVIRSKQLNISSYLDTLTQEQRKTPNPYLAKQIELYKNFVAELIKINFVLDKKFYLVISYSSLEKGLFGAKQVVSKNPLEGFSYEAKFALHSKAENIINQLSRIGLKSRVLEKDKIIKVFYDIFNDAPLTPTHTSAHAKAPVVTGKEAK